MITIASIDMVVKPIRYDVDPESVIINFTPLLQCAFVGAPDGNALTWIKANPLEADNADHSASCSNCGSHAPSGAP
jgi:hypothetical protein